MFYGDYYTKQIKGSDEKVNYIEIRINENDEPASFNIENELSLSAISFDNSKTIVYQLYKKGFVSEESGFDMAKITAFTTSKGKADLTKSSTIERNPTDIGTNSQSDGTGIAIDVLENLIEEPAIFTVEGVEYNGLATIIFSKLSMIDQVKLDTADYRIKNYVNDLKEEEYGARAILNYFEVDLDGIKKEKLVKVKSRGGFSIKVKKKNGKNLLLESYQYDDNNLVNEGMNLLGAITSNTNDSNSSITTKSREEIVFFNVVSEFDGIMILQDPVTNSIAVKNFLKSKTSNVYKMICLLESICQKNLKKYLNCKSLDDEIENLSR
ncbi:MAG: hypothetical protein HC854_17990, partial [Flavobacterium sp.]|nr:hypothetical protein [Flavobacterium sp.]